MEKKRKFALKDQAFFHLMMLPGMLLVIIFVGIPMFGILMAFQNYSPAKGLFGSQWVGLQHFRTIFNMPSFWQLLKNTLVISIGKIVFSMVISIIFAILLSECRFMKVRKWVQTAVYLPHFLSWVILGIMFSNMFSLSGMFNNFLGIFGIEPQLWLQSNDYFRTIMVATETWKEFGYGAIVYIAAILGIDSSLYEAADMDGATRMKKIWHITLPSILPTIILMTALSMGNVLNAGFDQVYNMYSPLVYDTGDIIDTFTYRVGLESLQFSMATAVGLFKSVIGFILLAAGYKIADKLCGYKIF
ncbi:MAG: ABC transporter permease subunit [Ruminococcus flavefaciens]|nr:ABC transporter permease subunit [Ruminococcus flavefaciens]